MVGGAAVATLTAGTAVEGATALDDAALLASVVEARVFVAGSAR
jgi:hypothetical protein